MGDRILFLGTGGDPIVVGKQYRASGGIILNIGENQFHIDPGPGSVVLSRMYGINLRQNTSLFISKNGLIEAGGANAVLSAMTHNGLDRRGVLIATKSSLNASEEDTPMIHPFYKGCVERFIALDPGAKVGINNIDIRITHTSLEADKGIGFRFITQRYSIGYTSDTALNKDMIEDFKNTDIMIISTVFPGDTPEGDHMCSADATEIMKAISPRLGVITNFGIKMLKADPLYEARQIQRNCQIQVIAAKDGLAIDPVNFSASTMQKTLKNF